MFEILISLFERAHLMYRDQSDDIKRAQWLGWNEHMHHYAERELFRRLWRLFRGTYDLDFVAHMDVMVAEIEASLPALDASSDDAPAA